MGLAKYMELPPLIICETKLRPKQGQGNLAMQPAHEIRTLHVGAHDLAATCAPRGKGTSEHKWWTTTAAPMSSAAIDAFGPKDGKELPSASAMRMALTDVMPASAGDMLQGVWIATKHASSVASA